MAERSPGPISHKGLMIERAANFARWSVRTRAADRAAWEAAYGILLPADRLRCSSSATGAVMWLGPDEWLVLMRPENADAFRDQCALIAPGHAPPTSIVEITHRNVGIMLSGPRATWVLNSGCPLDLSNDAFPVGACTRTLFGKAEVILWRREDALWHMECWRSFEPYIWTYLAHAAADEPAA